MYCFCSLYLHIALGRCGRKKGHIEQAAQRWGGCWGYRLWASRRGYGWLQWQWPQGLYIMCFVFFEFWIWTAPAEGLLFGVRALLLLYLQNFSDVDCFAQIFSHRYCFVDILSCILTMLFSLINICAPGALPCSTAGACARSYVGRGRKRLQKRGPETADYAGVPH